MYNILHNNYYQEVGSSYETKEKQQEKDEETLSMLHAKPAK